MYSCHVTVSQWLDTNNTSVDDISHQISVFKITNRTVILHKLYSIKNHSLAFAAVGGLLYFLLAHKNAAITSESFSLG